MKSHDSEDRRDSTSMWERFIRGYRFFIVASKNAALEALEVRRLVYAAKLGSQFKAPDVVDARSWLLAAAHIKSGRIVGTLRMTPSSRGPLECEHAFEVPHNVRAANTVELSRMAVLPEHRRRALTFPQVSLGLYRLVRDFGQLLELDWMVVASKPKLVSTYEWLGFEQTGEHANYRYLGNAPHSLLISDFRTAAKVEGNPMQGFFTDFETPNIVVPDSIPEAGAWLSQAATSQPSGKRRSTTPAVGHKRLPTDFDLA